MYVKARSYCSFIQTSSVVNAALTLHTLNQWLLACAGQRHDLSQLTIRALQLK